MKVKNIKVIFDTNVWISFLIGKRLNRVDDFISDNRISIVLSEQLLQEIREVTQRPKLKKYFPENKVIELIQLLDLIAFKVELIPTHFICRDPKDNFLLDLIDQSETDILVTGDKDLLEIAQFKSATIMTVTQFELLLRAF